jgi:hypothetical protein
LPITVDYNTVKVIPFTFYMTGIFWQNGIRLSKISGLYYKLFAIVIYDFNAIDQYYKTTIVDYECS